MAKNGRETTAVGPADDVSILKQINKVNDDGSYTFGYEASDGSFKVETRDVAGNVKGMFGFVDETGLLKRVSYSASNSSGFQAAADPAAKAPTRQGRRDVDDGKPVKKVLVSKRPVPEPETGGRRGAGNDPRRQLPRDEDMPDVYGVHGRSTLQSEPVSPVVSALMSELNPVRAAYRPPATVPTTNYASRRTETVDGRPRDQEDEPRYRVTTSPYPAYQMVQVPAAYQQPYPTPVSVQPYAFTPAPRLAALRDELMELILAFVQARVSQLPVYQTAAAPYPMPYQQPSYYVPSYYQGPRVQPGPAADDARQTAAQREDYAASASSPRVTQTLRDGLIRMLLSTSPRYEADSAASRLAYRRTTQSTPVRNVQILVDDGRPVTTESPD